MRQAGPSIRPRRRRPWRTGRFVLPVAGGEALWPSSHLSPAADRGPGGAFRPGAGRETAGRLAAALVLIAAMTGSSASMAQSNACPPPQKRLAGICVPACPGGYEDNGRECIYRNVR